MKFSSRLASTSLVWLISIVLSSVLVAPSFTSSAQRVAANSPSSSVGARSDAARVKRDLDSTVPAGNTERGARDANFATAQDTNESFLLDRAETIGSYQGRKRRGPTTPSHVRSATTTVQTETIGVYGPNNATFYERDSNTSGTPDTTFSYGPSGLGWIPIAGDWDGDGGATIGLYDPAHAAFFLRNSNTGGVADITFNYGPSGLGWIPLVGDWNGDGVDTVGLYDPAHAAFFLKNSNTSGIADITFTYGPGGLGWIPIVGDWNGDGVDTVGLYDPVNGGFFLRNSNTGGIADVMFNYGPGGLGWIPIVGDWDGDGVATIGLYDPVNGAFFLVVS